MVKLRTTIEPTKELDVEPSEAADLKAMGLVLEGTRATTDEGLTEAAIRQVTGGDTTTDGGDAGNTEEG